MEIALLVAEAFKFVFPAYCSNAIPVLVGGGKPLDFGRKLSDGNPIFGKNKTIRGFIAGFLVGSLVGFAESLVFNYPLYFGIPLSIGALLGDLFGAFIKRRLAIPPGGLLPIVDQVDFVVGALLLSSLFLVSYLTWQLAIVVLVVTPPVHLLTNFLAFKAGLKSNPW